VLALDRLREPHELAPVDRRQLPAEGQHALALGLGHLELAAAGERPYEGAVLARQTEPEGAGGLVEREREAAGRRLEPGGDPSEQPRGRRAEHAEPEALDVG
jgi:hypothetical protein